MCLVLFISCGNDDNNQENQDDFEGCCSPDPVFGDNVNNLDQTQGEIVVVNLFTPNSDGVRDTFKIHNINLYANHTVTIYNSNDEVLFESSNYGEYPNFFPSEQPNGITLYPDGTYKYKIVVENEQTFLKSGTFCLFTNNPVIEQNFSECDPLADGFDPIISGL